MQLCSNCKILFRMVSFFLCLDCLEQSKLIKAHLKIREKFSLELRIKYCYL